jgi:hypothetical protein
MSRRIPWEQQMALDFGHRFNELLKQAEVILEAKTQHRGVGLEGTFVDQNQLINWQVKARHLISMVCGQDSQHFNAFEKNEKPLFVGDSNHSVLLRQQAVLLAAKDDYEGGYLNKIRDLIQAQVFESELEQAEELLHTGHLTPAAVIAGTVLETTIRQMCLDKQIAIGKLDRMNADLAKAGVYNSLVQKRITALAAVRNSAAHGKPEEFTKDDVSAMIRDVERFVAFNTIDPS